MKIDFKKLYTENKKMMNKLLFALLGSFLIAMISELLFFRYYYQNMAADRVFIITCALFFVSMHFIIPLKKMYNFIYEKRFIIAIVLFILVILLGYSGSSINEYTDYIVDVDEQNTEVIGKSRGIRSDEWAVNTPLSFSQNMDEDNKLSYTSSIVRGTETDMFTVINAPVIDILTIAKPFTIGYIFGNSVGLSFWWFGRLIALALVSFEFSMLISKKNKLVSLCGMLMITFASATQWWFSNFLPDLLIFGQLALLMINKFIEATNLKTKIISACVFGISVAAYIFTFYPAWIISLGYVFLAIFVWIIWQHRKTYKINKRDVLIVLIVVILVGLLGIRYYMLSSDTLMAVTNTSYPGSRVEEGGDSRYLIFSYVYNIFTAYKNASNPSSTMATMVSFFPIPFLIACIYMFRNKKGRSFLIPLTLETIFFSIWICFGFGGNEILSKITLLYMVPASRAAIALSLLQTYMMIYLLGNIDIKDKIMPKKWATVLAFIFTVIIMFFAVHYVPENYMGAYLSSIATLILLVAIYLLLNLKHENKNKLIAFLIVYSLFTGVAVNPIIKGTDMIYETDLANGVQEIVADDSEALWITDNCNFPMSNYIVANGAKTLNSTNYYPNLDMLEIILGDQMDNEEIEGIYNRYAHITINLIEEETFLEIDSSDAYTINLNYTKLKDLNVKYILSSRKLAEETNFEGITFIERCAAGGHWIYEVEY